MVNGPGVRCRDSRGELPKLRGKICSGFCQGFRTNAPSVDASSLKPDKPDPKP